MQPTVGRRVKVNFSIDPEAVEILRSYYPKGIKKHGELISRLLFEHRARQEERARRELQATQPAGAQ